MDFGGSESGWQWGGGAQRFDSVPPNTATHKNVSFPSFCRSRNCRDIIISIVFPALLSLILVAYFCLSHRGLRVSNFRATRRLASSDEEEACHDLDKVIGTEDEVEARISLSPQDSLHVEAIEEGESSTERGHTRNNQDEDVVQATAPLIMETQGETRGLHNPADSLPGSSSEPSSAQQDAVLTQSFELSECFWCHEASVSPAPKEFETTSHGAELMGGLAPLEDAPEDWFVDYILGQSSTSPTEGSLQQSERAGQLVNEEREHLQNAGVVLRKSSRKRKYSTDGKDENVDNSKKRLNDKEAQNLTESLQGLSDPLLGLLETYFAQEQGGSPQESQFSWGLQGPEEASTSSTIEGFETAPHYYEPLGGSGLLEGIFEEGKLFEELFSDCILDPCVTSSPIDSVQQFEDEHQLAGELTANAADQQTPSSSPAPESQSFATDGSSSGNIQLPTVDAQGLQGPQMPAAVSEELGSRTGQEGQPSSTAPHNPEFNNTPVKAPSFLYLSAPPSTFYKPQTVTDGSQPSTSHVQQPGSSENLIASDEGALKEHPFFRLPNAEFSEELEPFSVARATMYTSRAGLSTLLNSVRRLLIKRQLGSEELQSLVMLGEKLVRHVDSMGRFSQRVLPLGDLHEAIARRFLVADMLWSICQVVGSPMRKSEWWDLVMDKLLRLPNTRVTSRMMQTSRFHILQRMIAALRIYRKGNRPPAQEVVELKRSIFSSPESPAVFRAPEFDTFRDDDAR